MARIPWLGDVLREAGLPVVEHGDWVNRSRSGTFEPIGVLWHHTGGVNSTPGNPRPNLSLVINGRSDLPGPLAHALVDYNGVFHLISGGRANHAGSARASGPIPAGSGNEMLIGWEIDYSGDQPSTTGIPDQAMTAAQYNNSVIATAAVLRRLGRDASYARGHRETSIDGKIDPSFIDLDRMRADVAQRMAAPPARPVSVPGGPTLKWGDSLQYFAAGHGDNKLWQKPRNGAGTWLSWADLGGTITGTVSATKYADLLAVTARTPDNLLHHRAYRPGTGWLPWVNLAGPIASDPITIGDGNTIHLFARGTNDALQYRHYTAGHTAWSPYINLSGAIKGKPTVVKLGDSINVFARGTDDNLWYQSLRPGQGWAGWTPLGGPIGGDPTAVSEGSTLHLFARGTNAKLQYKSYTLGHGWTPYINLDGTIQ